MVQRIVMAAALGAAGLALGGCADHDGYGGGLGYAGYYDEGAYGGYGPAGYYEPYGYGGYGFGWYGDFYYPGIGIYVYDRERRPYRWTDGQRRYWQSRRGYGNPQGRGNWQAFGGGVRDARQGDRQDVSRDRQALPAGTFRAQRGEARQAYGQSVRQQEHAAGASTPRSGFAGGARGGSARGGGGRGPR